MGGKSGGLRLRSLKDAEQVMGKSAFLQAQKQVEAQELKDKSNHKIKSLKQKAKKAIREEDTPEYHLQQLFKEVFEPQYKVTTQDKLIPGRRFSVDVGVLGLKLCGELDGYMHHGFNKEGFKRDRIKDRLHVLEGYQIIRFFASEVLQDPVSVREYLRKIKVVREEQLSASHSSLTGLYFF